MCAKKRNDFRELKRSNFRVEKCKTEEKFLNNMAYKTVTYMKDCVMKRNKSYVKSCQKTLLSQKPIVFPKKPIVFQHVHFFIPLFWNEKLSLSGNVLHVCYNNVLPDNKTGKWRLDKSPVRTRETTLARMTLIELFPFYRCGKHIKLFPPLVVELWRMTGLFWSSKNIRKLAVTRMPGKRRRHVVVR